MPPPVFAIGLMGVLGVAAVMLIAWLSSRPTAMLRTLGAPLSGVVSIYCLIYVVALIAESRAGFKPLGAAMLSVFAATAVGAVYAAFRGFRHDLDLIPQLST
jgi:glucan phosphoethanolaminetransferase (alkaline phosphatase superfamily)